jgi:hypothetical protein
MRVIAIAKSDVKAELGLLDFHRSCMSCRFDMQIQWTPLIDRLQMYMCMYLELQLIDNNG